jgi:hypothetical protein
MAKDDGSRQFKRVALRRDAWIEGENNKLVPCVVEDISDKGAQLSISDQYEPPADFPIRLTPDGGVRRSCHIVWRKAGSVGVSFGGRASDT